MRYMGLIILEIPAAQINYLCVIYVNYYIRYVHLQDGGSPDQNPAGVHVLVGVPINICPSGQTYLISAPIV